MSDASEGFLAGLIIGVIVTTFVALAIGSTLFDSHLKKDCSGRHCETGSPTLILDGCRCVGPEAKP